MDDEKIGSRNETPKPTGKAEKDQGETKKVDTKVQEEASREREESGGYT
jgi:hypothetical protein